MQSFANCTGLPTSSESLVATGFKVYFGSGLPLGRPRCEARISRPPFSMTCLIDGSDALMRVSSVILPSEVGTLKSTRIKTRLPFRSRSEIESLFILYGFALSGSHSLRSFLYGFAQSGSHSLRSFHNKFDQIDHTAAESPFIVVPRKHFDHPIAKCLGELSVQCR